MTEERVLQVPYHMVGAVVGWVTGVLMMTVASLGGPDGLARWSLVVIAGAVVWSVSYIVTRSRCRLLDAIDLLLRMHEQGGEQDLPRVPSLR